MALGVVDAGVAIAWLQGHGRTFPRIQRLFAAARQGRAELVVSVVNLAEVLRHTADLARATGVDPVALLQAHRVRLHAPDEQVARRVARLATSLGDGFAAATALELGARLHTTDGELVSQARRAGVTVTAY